MKKILIMSVVVMMAGMANAAPIQWDPETTLTDTTGGTEVRTDGTLHVAYNMGGDPATTVNGVLFVSNSAGVPSGFSPGFNFASSLADIYGVYDGMLNSIEYSGTSGDFVITGLTPTEEYMVQLFFGEAGTWLLTAGDGDGDASNDYTSTTVSGTPHEITGYFTADDPNQTVASFLSSLGSTWGRLSAYQVRSGVAAPAVMSVEVGADIYSSLTFTPDAVLDGSYYTPGPGGETYLWAITATPVGGEAASLDDYTTTLTPVLTAPVAGIYTITLTVTDATQTPTSVTDTVYVSMHDTACEATAAVPGFEYDIADTNEDCKVNFADVEDVALTWLEDQTVYTQQVSLP